MEIFQDMNWIDGIITGTLLLSSVWGLFRGLVQGVFGILALVASFIAAQKYGAVLGKTMVVLLGESIVSAALGYVLVFILGMLVFGALTYLARKTIARADLGMFDKFGGLVFGAVRGGILGALFVLLLAAFPLQKAAAWRESVMVPMLGGALNAAANLPPLRDYRGYLAFDSRNRPRWAIALGGEQTADADKKRSKKKRAKQTAQEQALYSASQRDELLDQLNDEATAQSLHNNASARRNAVALKDELREESFLQKLSALLEQFGRDIECGGDCGEEEE